MKKKIEAYVDGGSRGNPGPAACAFVVYEEGNEIYSFGKYLSVKTNNEAEYLGLINCLLWLKNNINFSDYYNVIVFMDSELVVEQIAKIYKVKSLSLKKYYIQACDLLKNMDGNISVVHTRRDKNIRADMLVNQVLDEK